MGVTLTTQLMRHIFYQVSPWTRVLRRSNADSSSVVEQLRLYELLVWIAYSTRRPVRFLICTLMALNLAERYGFMAETARCFSGIGATLDFAKVHWLATYYHRRAVELANQIQHPRALGLSYFCLAFHEERLGSWDNALSHYRLAATTYWAMGDLRDWGKATGCVSRVYTHLGHLTLGLEESKKLIRVGEQSGDCLVRGWGELRTGDNLMRLGRLDIAVKHLQQACTLLKSVPEFHTLAEAHGLLARSYWRQGNVSHGLDVVQEREKLRSKRRFKKHYTRFAELYLAVAENSTGTEKVEALKKAKLACQATRTSHAHDLGDKPRVYRLRAKYAWLSAKPKRASKWWRRSLRSAGSLSARWELGITHLEMGRYLREPSHLRQALLILTDVGATWDASQAKKLWQSIGGCDLTSESDGHYPCQPPDQ